MYEMQERKSIYTFKNVFAFICVYFIVLSSPFPSSMTLIWNTFFYYYYLMDGYIYQPVSMVIGELKGRAHIGDYSAACGIFSLFFVRLRVENWCTECWLLTKELCGWKYLLILQFTFFENFKIKFFSFWVI